jgi:hypothetical protein
VPRWHTARAPRTGRAPERTDFAANRGDRRGIAVAHLAGMAIDDRREWERHETGVASAVHALVDNLAVDLVDVSRTGARFVSARRLSPGLRVSLRLTRAGAVVAVRGRVVHSTVVRLRDGGLGYEAAITFDAVLMADDDGGGIWEALRESA